jgi:hypothetical protein
VGKSLARVRNGLEYLSVRTARKAHYCESKRSGCAGAIKPGDQYVLAELPPNSEIGNDRWWRMPICSPCGHVGKPGVVEQLFPDEYVTEWLIWSNHHKSWWGPNGSGYRRHIADAGRYALADTPQWLTRGCDCCAAPEVLVPAPTVQVLTESSRLAEYASSAPRAATRKAGQTNRYFKAPARAPREPAAARPTRIQTLVPTGGVL